MPDKPVVLLTNPMHPDGEAILAPHVRLITAPDPQPDTLRKWAVEADGIIVRAVLKGALDMKDLMAAVSIFASSRFNPLLRHSP